MNDKVLEKDVEEYSRDSILYEMHRGRQGMNEGFNNGLAKAGEFLHGVQKQTYTLIGADSGSYKTTFADYAYVLSPYFHYLKLKREGSKKKIKFLYFSWELSKIRKKIRFSSAFMCAQFGVRLPVNYLLSKGKFRCSDEHWNLAKKIEPIVEQVFDAITVIDEPKNSRQVFQILKKFAEAHGTFHTTMITNQHGDPEEIITGYTPYDPDLLLEVVIDHLSLADEDYGMNLKQTMDQISKFGVYFRNRCGMSFIVIQQFSSEMQTTDRRKLDKDHIIPMRNDFGDTKYTYRDADVVWGLIVPHKFGFQDFNGYSVSRLQSSYLESFLLKNRDGPDGQQYGMFVDPVAHTFSCMPRPALDLIGKLDSFYLQADQLRSELDKEDFSDQIPKQLNK